MTCKSTDISNVIGGLTLKSEVLFAMIFMFMAAHVYISSQPVSAVVMAEILEEHEEEADHFLIDGDSEFFDLNLHHVFDLTSLESNSSKAFFILPILSGIHSEDPPPPRA